MTRQPLLRALALLVLMLVPSLAHAQGSDGDAVALLHRMIEAERTLSVEGRVTERIALPGVTPDPQGRSFTLPAGITPELVTQAFELRLGEATDVGGRAVDVLELEGRGALTPHWTFWIDHASGARLAYRLQDSAGNIVAAGRYEQIDEVRKRSTPRDLPSPALAEADGNLALARLLDPALAPGGYVAVGMQRITLGRDDVPALRVTYWNGLDALVVLIYGRQAAATPDAEHVASRVIGRFGVTVIGAAPKRALARWLQHMSDGPLARLDPARTLRPGNPR